MGAISTPIMAGTARIWNQEEEEEEEEEEGEKEEGKKGEGEEEEEQEGERNDTIWGAWSVITWLIDITNALLFRKRLDSLQGEVSRVSLPHYWLMQCVHQRSHLSATNPPRKAPVVPPKSTTRPALRP